MAQGMTGKLQYGITLKPNGSFTISQVQPCGGLNLAVCTPCQIVGIANGERFSRTIWQLSTLHIHEDEPEPLAYGLHTSEDRAAILDFADSYAIGASVGDPRHGLGRGQG
jgi:hypothetical protein